MPLPASVDTTSLADIFGFDLKSSRISSDLFTSLPGGISLSLESPGLHNADRFATLFQRAFNRLPDHVRSRMWLRWHNRLPRIGLIGGLILNCGGEYIEPKGAYNPDCEGFLFAWEWLGGQPDEVVMYVVAHEIAHAFLRAIGENYKSEDAVDRLTDAWQFKRPGA
jgi:hypothetical protein